MDGRGKTQDEDLAGPPTDEEEAGHEEYRLAPPADPLSAWDKALQRQLADEGERSRFFVPVEVQEEPLRFSVRDTFLLITFAAVMFSLSRLIKPEVYAGVLGGITFLGLVILSIAKPQKSILHVGWWVLLVVYLLTAVAAIVWRN